MQHWLSMILRKITYKQVDLNLNKKENSFFCKKLDKITSESILSDHKSKPAERGVSVLWGELLVPRCSSQMTIHDFFSEIRFVLGKIYAEGLKWDFLQRVCQDVKKNVLPHEWGGIPAMMTSIHPPLNYKLHDFSFSSLRLDINF